MCRALAVVCALCALAASLAQGQGDLQALNNLLKQGFVEALNDIKGAVPPDLYQQAILELKNNVEDKTEYMKAPTAVEKEVVHPTEISKPQSVETVMATMKTHIDDKNITNKMDDILKRLVSLETVLQKQIDDVMDLINNNILKRLNHLEDKYNNKVNATDGTNVTETRSVTVSSSSEWSTQPAGGNYTQTYTLSTDVVETSTRESNHSESGVDVELDAVRVLAVGDRDDSGWWRAFCADPAPGAVTPARAWGPGVLPGTDTYDYRLRLYSGCRRRLVPAYDRQKFEWRLPRPPSPQPVPALRLAVRTVGTGRADIKIYWNGEKKYYFAFSNSSSTVEFCRVSPWRVLWRQQLPHRGRGEHYTPLHIVFTQDAVVWQAGCGGQVLATPVPTGREDTLALEVETSAFPAKLLYDCPQDP